MKVYKISTGTMNDYDRTGSGSGVTGSRFGTVESLTQQPRSLHSRKTDHLPLRLISWTRTRQRSSWQRLPHWQQREIVIPEVDSYVYGVMAAGAGTKPKAVTLTADNIYDEITKERIPLIMQRYRMKAACLLFHRMCTGL